MLFFQRWKNTHTHQILNGLFEKKTQFYILGADDLQTVYEKTFDIDINDIDLNSKSIYCLGKLD